MATRLFCILFIVLVFLSGCAKKVPFTHEMRKEFDLGPNELQLLQYYISGEVVLHRELSNNEVITEGHKLKIVNDMRLEEVRFKKGIPGIAISSSENLLEISFEEGNSLIFGSYPDKRNSRSGKYMFSADKWTYSTGFLSYDDKHYRAVEGSRYVYLLVDLKELNKFKKESRTVKGIRLE